MALRFLNLDRPSIRRLKPGERITEHGITAECLADGDLRYSVGVMVDGKRIHRVVGKASDGVTRTQCEDFIEKVRTEARSGRLSLPTGRKLALTLVQRRTTTSSDSSKAPAKTSRSRAGSCACT